MYDQMRIDYLPKLPYLGLSVSLLYQQARAYLWNGDCDEAEATVLQGFRELFAVYGQEGGLAKDEFTTCLITLLGAYNRKVLLASPDCSDERLLFAIPTLTAMLSVSNLGEKCDDILLSVLKPEFRNDDIARRAVLKALQTQSVEDFRAAVGSWTGDPQDFKFEVKCTTESGSRKVVQELKRKSTESARSYTRESAQKRGSSILEEVAQAGVNRALCNNPSCTQQNILEDKPSRCSRCKASFYCSRDCQVAHWKVHKQSCSASQSVQ